MDIIKQQSLQQQRTPSDLKRSLLIFYQLMDQTYSEMCRLLQVKWFLDKSIQKWNRIAFLLQVVNSNLGMVSQIFANHRRKKKVRKKAEKSPIMR